MKGKRYIDTHIYIYIHMYISTCVDMYASFLPGLLGNSMVWLVLAFTTIDKKLDLHQKSKHTNIYMR